MENLQSVEQFEQLKNEEAIVFVFSANWFKDCVFIEPFMPEVVEKFSNVRFVKVDRDQFIDLCIELDVFGIPSFLAYSKGVETGRLVAKIEKRKKRLKRLFKI